MKEKQVQLILLSTAVTVAVLLLILWLVDFSGFNLPEFIPVLNLKTYSFLILIAFIVILIFFQKLLLRKRPGSSITILITYSILICFASMIIYQVIRRVFIMGDEMSLAIYTILLSSLIVTAFFTLVAASIAIELKKVKGPWGIAINAMLVLLVLYVKFYAPHVEW